MAQIPIYRVEACLSASPSAYTTLSNVLVSAQIARGRADEQATIQTGVMTLVLDNGTGAFSPDNASGPYYGYLLPGRKVRLSARMDTSGPWYYLYTGYIDSIAPVDNGPMDGDVVIQCVDWLGLMSQKAVTATINTNAPDYHDLSAAFGIFMAAIDSTATYSFVNPTDGVSQHFLAYSLVDANALSAITEFADCMRGVIFAGRDGVVYGAANGGEATATLFGGTFVFDQAVANGAANVVPYSRLDYDLTTQFLFNDVTITAPAAAGGAQNAQDAASIAQYGKRSLRKTFNYMGPDQALAMASTLMLAYRQPHPRIHALEVDIDAATGVTAGGHTAADLLFALELTATVTVRKSQPGNLGIDRSMAVQGIAHDIKPGLAGHTVTLLLGEQNEVNPGWQLDVSKLGVDTFLGYAKAPFDPTAIAGCTLYLRVDRGLLVSGSNVTSWTDQSGAGTVASPSGSVTLVANQQAGFGAVKIANSGAAGQLTLSANPIATANWTIFAVSGTATTNTGNLLLVTGSGSRRKAFGLDPTYLGATISDNDGTNSAFATARPPTSSGYHLYGGSSTAGVPVSVTADGGAAVTANAGGTLSAWTATSTTMGDNVGALGNYQPYWVVALLCYSRVLTPAEYATVLNGLNGLFLIY